MNSPFLSSVVTRKQFDPFEAGIDFTAILNIFFYKFFKHFKKIIVNKFDQLNIAYSVNP